MGTAISKAALALPALAIGLAGCGASGHSSSGPANPAGSSPATAAAPTTAAAPRTPGAAFAWLRPRPAPASWRVAQIPSGAELPYPPGWRLIKTDPGTATAALQGRGGNYLGYLNITPQQGPETLRNWRTFRIHHDADEGDRSVTRLAYAGGLRFLDGHGNCVKDAYVSGSGVHYIEIACLVAGTKHNTVIVGAGPPSSWARVSGSIERAISGFRT